MLTLVFVFVTEKVKAIKTFLEVAHKECQFQVFVTGRSKQHQELYI